MTTDARDAAAIEAASGSRGFLGWQIVAVGFLAQLVVNGVTLSAIGNFVTPISSEFGVSDAAIGIAPALAILTMGILGPFLGPWVDRGWTRRIMILGALLTGCGLILLSLTTEVWQLGAVYVSLVCVGGALFGVLPTTTMIANWFIRRRGLMLGIVIAGATVASYAGPALAQVVMDADGWRTALRYMGVFTLVTALPVFAAFVIGRPEDVGQLPDGAEKPPELEGVPRVIEGAKTAGELARDPVLWQVSIGFGLIMTSPVVMIGLLVPFGESLGFSGQQATFFFAAMAPFSILGKLVIGGLADVAPLKPSIAMTVLVNILVWMLLYTDPSYSLFVATGALYGIGIGGAAPLHGVLVGRCFGRANFGTVGGLGGLASIPLIVLVQVLSQVLKVATGSHHASFVVQGFLLLLGGLMLGFVRIPPPEGSVDPAPAHA